MGDDCGSDSEDDVPLAVRARQMAAAAANGAARKPANGTPSGLLASRERAQQAQKARAQLVLKR